MFRILFTALSALSLVLCAACWVFEAGVNESYQAAANLSLVTCQLAGNLPRDDR